ncbi:hypothetical protein FGIG_10240 [Fasciola gigantica]|uniref:Uncharacterized protein n=1 Tax=Fasciola gigantica TaxID=46835 RepID=A0A504YP67_FASGI|nr:hypothetical protein FGIG_10240 [Fasciola gigantica]
MFSLQKPTLTVTSPPQHKFCKMLAVLVESMNYPETICAEHLQHAQDGPSVGELATARLDLESRPTT